MTTATAPLFLETNRRTINRYLVGLFLLYGGLIVAAFSIGRMDFAAAIIGVPLMMGIVAFPRVALTIFIATIFFEFPASWNTDLIITDFTSLLVIGAAIIDLLVGRAVPRSFPKLTFHFVALMIVVFVTALASTRPELAVSSSARLIMLLAVFLSVFRLTRHTGFGFIPKVFFWLCTVAAIPAIVHAIETGGALRSFGFSRLVLDDFTMLSLPIGLSLFLFARRGVSTWYIFGMALVLGGLIATQSRLSMTLSFLSCFLVLYLVRKSRAQIQQAGGRTNIRFAGWSATRMLLLALAVLIGVGIVLSLEPELFGAVIDRFKVMFGGGRIGDSYVTRLSLWSAAFRAFIDHPILGIGPGNFRSIMYLYPDLAFDYAYLWVRGFSSHNLLLHYLAETGIVGGIAVISLFIGALRYSIQSWRRNRLTELAGSSLSILLVATIFMMTAFVEAGWMWGQTGFVMALFMAAIARQREELPPLSDKKES